MENNVMQKVSCMTSKAFLCPIPMVFVEETCGYIVSDSHPSQATIILGCSSVPECKRSSHLGLLIVYTPSREGHETLIQVSGHSTPPAVCNCVLIVQNLRERLEHSDWKEDRTGGGSIRVALRKPSSCLAKTFLVQPVGGEALIPHQVTLHICSVKKANKFVCSPE